MRRRTIMKRNLPGILLLLSAFFLLAHGGAAEARGITQKYMQTESRKQIYGLPREEIPKLMQKCIRNTRSWNYSCVISDPVWQGGRRWDCSAFVVYFYNAFVLPRAERLNQSVRFEITDEAGRPLKNWAMYPYETRDGAPLINNTTTILSRAGAPWKSKQVRELVRTYRGFLKGKSLDASLLPEVGDLLLYGWKEKNSYVIKHVGIYLGECFGEGKGYFMAECTTNKARSVLGMKKSQVIGNRNEAAINPFWVYSKEKRQELLWVKIFVAPEKWQKPAKKK